MRAIGVTVVLATALHLSSAQPTYDDYDDDGAATDGNWGTTDGEASGGGVSDDAEDSWFDNLGVEGQVVLLTATALLLVGLGILFAKTLMTTRNLSTQSKRMRRQRHADKSAKQKATDDKFGTLSDALGKGYVIKNTGLNPMRSPDFKPVMEMLRANGEFDDEEDVGEVYFVALKEVAAIPSEQLVGCMIGDVILKLDMENEWIWGMLRGKEGWFDPLNMRQLNEQEIKDMMTARDERRAKRARDERRAKRAQAGKKVSVFPATTKVAPAASGKLISAAGGKLVSAAGSKAPTAPGTLEASGPRLSQLIQSSPSASETLAWDPSEASPTASADNGTTRPDANAAVNVTVKTLAAARRKALAFDNRKEHVGNASTVVKPAASNAVKEPPANKSSDAEVVAQPVGNPAVEFAANDTVEFAANDNGTAGVIGDAAALDLTALELVTDGTAEGSPTPEVGSTKPTSTAVATGRPKHLVSPVLGRPAHQSPIDPTVAKHFYEMFK